MCAGAEENVLHYHTQVMIHQPSGGAQGVATDGNQLERNVETERQMYKIISTTQDKHSIKYTTIARA
jgi:ATP-dependent protease ClpP protease subunit